jgi:hypothetical protein
VCWRPRRRVAAFVAALLFLLLFVVRAEASPSARLVYSRATHAEACPDEEALRRAVAARVGYDPFFPWAPLTVVAQVERRGDRFFGRVEVVDEHARGRGSRELSSDHDDCSELISAMALAISIVLDTESAGVRPSPVTAGDPPVAPAPLPTIVIAPSPEVLHDEPRAPTVRDSSDTSWRTSAGAEMSSSVGLTPSVALGPALFGALRRGAFSLGLEVSFADGVANARSARGGVHAWALSGSVVPCFHVGPAFGCGVALIGVLDGAGSEIASARSASAPILGGGARVGIQSRLGEVFFFRLHADVLANFTRTTMQLDGEAVWSAPIAFATFGAGVGVHFP